MKTELTCSKRTLFRWLSICLALLLTAGCGDSKQAEGPPGPGQAAEHQQDSVQALTAAGLIQQVVDRYRQADQYRDMGEITLDYRLQGIPQRETGQLVTRWSSRGQLYLRCYQLEVACQPDRLEARMHDRLTDHLDGQQLVQPLSVQLTLDELLADPVLGDILLAGQAGIPLPLLFLLDPDGAASQLGDPDAAELLADAEIDGLSCFRLKVTTEAGPMVLWIDKEQQLVRRQELPAAAFAADLLADSEVSEVKLRADFKSVELPENQLESAFELTPLVTSQHVNRFVLPPPPLVTDLLGRRPGRFELVAAGGDVVTRDSLRGKITVLAWCRASPSCRTVLSKLAELTAATADQPDLAVLAVFSDPADVTDELIADTLKKWKLSFSPLRDEDALAAEICQLSHVPSLMVLDTEGRVQLVIAGVNETQLGSLPAAIDRLRAGQDLAQQALDADTAREQTYREDLLSAIQAATATFDVAAQAAPELFKLTLLWESDAASHAGHVLLLPQVEGAPHVLVVDDGRSVVQLAGDGTVAGRHELPGGPEQRFMLLRAAAAGGTQAYAAFTPGDRQLLLLDEDFKQQLAYPDSDQPHEGVSQVQLTDLEDDGTLELYVGFWGVTGVQRVSLEGVREWGYRGVSDVLSLATTPRNEVGWQKLLVTDQQGRLLQLNQFGNADLPVDTGVIPLHHLFSGLSGPAVTTVLCGLSSTDSQQIVGLDLDLNIRWRFPVALGTFAAPVEMITSLQLPDSPVAAWLVAAANGEVHLVAHDGSYADRFAIGERISGIATADYEDQAFVVISTASSVRCWSLALAGESDP
jgi:hypothetical protein